MVNFLYSDNLVFVYLLSNADWSESQILHGGPSDQFGSSVAVYDSVIVVGASTGDTVSVRTGLQHSRCVLIPTCSFSFVDFIGTAYIFITANEQWYSEASKLQASDAAEDDRFGKAVSLYGDSVVIGANENTDNGAGTGNSCRWNEK